MIGEVLSFLKDQLNAELSAIDTEDDKVSYIDLGTDPPGFQKGVNMFLINLEEETQLRPANRYQIISENGQKLPARPPLRLNMYVVFAAKASEAKNYDVAVGQLSNILQFFQAHPVFLQEQYPEMREKGLNELFVEFSPLTYSQQNEIWSAMKRAYLPSACFKIKMIVIQAEPLVLEGEIETTELTFRP